MLKIDIYKNGEFTRVTNVASVILQKSGILELITAEGESACYLPSEYDWFNVLPQ